jgi:hypothetical protein
MILASREFTSSGIVRAIESRAGVNNEQAESAQEPKIKTIKDAYTP